MPQPTWNDCYASGQLPWDTGVPDPMLVRFVDAGGVRACRALEIGSGTGTNALWLAQRGFDVLGIDLAPLAVEQARSRVSQSPVRCQFATLDFMTETLEGQPFEFVFDRGCWHIFDEAEERARFAARVAALLAPGGLWLSLIGSTEGPARDTGPPRRSARDIALAIEPELEIVELRSEEFHSQLGPAKAWFCLSRRRLEPAQPSSRR